MSRSFALRCVGALCCIAVRARAPPPLLRGWLAVRIDVQCRFVVGGNPKSTIPSVLGVTVALCNPLLVGVLRNVVRETPNHLFYARPRDVS